MTSASAASSSRSSTGGRSPFTVLGVALLASRPALGLRAEARGPLGRDGLLPRDSPGFQAFERRLARVGGRATITVVVESPERSANERFIDALDDALDKMPVEERALIAFVESGSKDVRAFFQDHKWLYASAGGARGGGQHADHQIAIQSGLVEDLEGGETQRGRRDGEVQRRSGRRAPTTRRLPTG